MTRRGLLKGLLAAGITGTLSGRSTAAQQPTTQSVEELQKNWKMLLAQGISVPAPSQSRRGSSTYARGTPAGARGSSPSR